MANKKYWSDFKNTYNVPRIKDYSVDWFEYWEKIKEDGLGYEYLTPDDNYTSDLIACWTYIIVGSLAFCFTAFSVNYFLGFVAYLMAVFFVFIFFAAFQKVAFVKIPYKKYCKKMRELEKQEKQRLAEEKAAINSGDLVAKYKLLKNKAVELPLKSTTTKKKLDEVFSLAEKLVNLSVTNPAFSGDVSRYINIYLTEVVNSIEKNQQNMDSPEIYEKYLREINVVLEKLGIVFAEAVEDVVEINAMPIDASLKAVYNMLDGEQMGGGDLR